MYNYFIKSVIPLISIVSIISTGKVSGQSREERSTVKGIAYEVRDGKKVPLNQATIRMLTTESSLATSGGGKFEFRNVPKGEIRLTGNYLGKTNIDTVLSVNGDRFIELLFQEDSYRLEDVRITAVATDKTVGTSSAVGRTAIDHLQANSLADVMSLMPGGLTNNPDLTSNKQINIRGVANSPLSSNAFGTSIIVNGAPVSNNANMQTMNPTVSGIGASMSGGAAPAGGIDVRNIPIQNIESVEVIRGIPSVEYGDIASGAVIINQKAGRQPLLVEARTNQNLNSLTATQGLILGEKGGALNIGADYSYNISDPVQSYRYYQRATFNTLYSNQFFNNRLSTNTGLAVNFGKDTRKLNPDDEVTKTRSSGKELGFTFTTNGNLSVADRWLKSVKYAGSIGYTNKQSSTQQQNTSANAPYSMTYTDGAVLSNFPGRKFYDKDGQEITRTPDNERDLYAVYLPSTYVGEYSLDGKEFNAYFKGIASFFNKTGRVSHRWLLGADFKTDKNLGQGKRFADSLPPYRSGTFQDANFRRRVFKDIPALQQFGVFAEENINIPVGSRELNISAGLRYDLFNGDQSGLSPRFNADMEIVPDILRIRGGYGLLSKAPSLLYLHPENAYFEFININELATNAIPVSDRVFMTTTRVFETENPELKIAKNQKAELGLDLNIKKSRLRVTAFQETLRDGYAFGIASNSFRPVDYIQYRRVSNVQPVYTATSNPVLAKFNTPNNSNRSDKKGIEFELNLKRFDAIRTQFSLNGMHVQQKVYSSEYNYYDLQSGDEAASRTHVGMYDPAMEVAFEKSTVSALRTTHNIPKIGLVVTLTTEVTWNQSDWAVYGNDSIPVKYISKNDGQIYDFDASKANEAEFRSIIRPVARTKERVESLPPLVNFNINITKEVQDFLRVSFFANNMFRSYQIAQSDRVKTEYYSRNIPFYFGLNLAMKIN